MTRAQATLADIASSRQAAAVNVMVDFGLVDACHDAAGHEAWCPGAPYTRKALATTLLRATALLGDAPAGDGLAQARRSGWLSQSAAAGQAATGTEAVRAWLAALGTPTGSDAAAGAAAQARGLLAGLDGLDLGAPLDRDTGARLAANALRASDGRGALPLVRHGEPVSVGEGRLVLERARVFQQGDTAVQANGTAELVVRDSRIDGASSTPTRVLSGPPGGLLVAGSIRTTLTLAQAQSFFINSRVTSKDWAALSTDGALPATAAGQQEQHLHAYGTQATVAHGGYGVYSDLFCNVLMYGGSVTSAEVGVISGSYGRVALGTLADAEGDAPLAQRLTAADRARAGKPGQGTTVRAGRNALMVHAVNLPPYWAFAGYSQAEFPLHVAEVKMHGGTLATDLSLDRKAEYPANRQGYIRHVAGSVILVRSANVDLALDGVRLRADPKGTGAVLHTVINADTQFMVKVPDGERHPGSHVAMRSMDVQGDVIAEDYQRDLRLELQGTRLAGRIVQGTASDWNTAAQAGGYTDVIVDPAGYHKAHGVHLELGAGSTWKVTGDSQLASLDLAAGARLVAAGGHGLALSVDGAQVPVGPGHYEGKITLHPL